MPKTSSSDWRLASLLLPAMLAWLPVASASAPSGMVLVPAGDFVMGADDGAYDEAPAHRVTLSAYYIDRYEVTVGEFAEFVRATQGVDAIEGPWFRYSTEGCLDVLEHYERRYGSPLPGFEPPPAAAAAAASRLDADLLRWTAGVAALRVLLGGEAELAEAPVAVLRATASVRAAMAAQARLPVRGVSWRDAAAYARWAGKRLPTEAEWEKAARGPDARIYPWGSTWAPGRSRAGLDVDAGPAAVGSFPDGASPYGCHDLAGNVWEWCADWYGPSTYTNTDRTSDPAGPPGLPDGQLPRQDWGARQFAANPQQGRESDTRKVLRGGCWVGGGPGQLQFNQRAARRLWANPGYWSGDTGFRCAKDFE